MRHDGKETDLRNTHPGGSVNRRLRSKGGVVQRSYLRTVKRSLVTVMVAIIAAASLTVAVDQKPASAEAIPWNCAAWAGWGIVETGATVASSGWITFIIGSASVGMTVKQINEACGLSATQHVGYKKLCHDQKFMYRSPISGKLVYDNRTHACENPYVTDDVLCKYLRPPGMDGDCFWQAMRNINDYLLHLSNKVRWYWGTPFDFGIF